MATYEELRHHIVSLLFKKHYIGKRHAPIESISRGLPSHEKGECAKVAKALLKDRDQWLLPYPTKHGVDVRLNPEKMKEIKTYLESFNK